MSISPLLLLLWVHIFVCSSCSIDSEPSVFFSSIMKQKISINRFVLCLVDKARKRKKKIQERKWEKERITSSSSSSSLDSINELIVFYSYTVYVYLHREMTLIIVDGKFSLYIYIVSIETNDRLNCSSIDKCIHLLSIIII
jgi:hypothetical protein